MVDDAHQFWVAATAPNGTMIFGPYTFQDASDQRAALKRSLGGEDGISSVYASANRDSAETNASFYLPQA